MPLNPRFVNVTDLAIYRPLRTGPGGDTDPADDTLIAGGLSAIVQRTNKVRKDRNGVDVVIEGLYFLAPAEADGTPIQVRERDYVQHTRVGGGGLERRQILSVSYETLLDGQIDHIELEV